MPSFSRNNKGNKKMGALHTTNKTSNGIYTPTYIFTKHKQLFGKINVVQSDSKNLHMNATITYRNTKELNYKLFVRKNSYKDLQNRATIRASKNSDFTNRVMVTYRTTNNLNLKMQVAVDKTLGWATDYTLQKQLFEYGDFYVYVTNMSGSIGATARAKIYVDGELKSNTQNNNTGINPSQVYCLASTSYVGIEINHNGENYRITVLYQSSTGTKIVSNFSILSASYYSETLIHFV